MRQATTDKGPGQLCQRGKQKERRLRAEGRGGLLKSVQKIPAGDPDNANWPEKSNHSKQIDEALPPRRVNCRRLGLAEGRSRGVRGRQGVAASPLSRWVGLTVDERCGKNRASACGQDCPPAEGRFP
ncbi:uncharacterized protein VTP21DRAFT_4670 [Calcarisporiella thermophila]|uniref:uncharacterized protein n=1 Tax=Calcarisporiella thermophila TaxID=911321 RepID=UPI003743C992